ncbi:MAG: hypothetical protein ACRCU1_02385 [Alsobacter sp.]
MYSVGKAGKIRKHWEAGDSSPHCGGSDKPAAPHQMPAIVRAPDVLRGRLPLSGDRTFIYEAPHPLILADVKRIAATLLLHVDGVAEKAWIEAVAAGLVADMCPDERGM